MLDIVFQGIELVKVVAGPCDHKTLCRWSRPVYQISNLEGLLCLGPQHGTQMQGKLILGFCCAAYSTASTLCGIQHRMHKRTMAVHHLKHRMVGNMLLT
jgi:hypothetical protein